jgi:hypothetical protein
MSENKTGLKRSLGLIDTSLVAGSMIGSGIFYCYRCYGS